MDTEIRARIVEGTSKLAGDLIRALALRPKSSKASESPSEMANTAPEKENVGKTSQEPAAPPILKAESTETALPGPPEAKQGDIATACVPCCSDHFSTCAGLLSDEAMRMVRRKGIQDREVIRRILDCSDQLNAMEREDLAPSKIEALPPWEKELAIYAQNKGAEIRHLLNNISSVEDLERAASETKRARNYIGSEWHKGRLASMRTEEKEGIAQRAEAIHAKLGKGESELSLEEAQKLAAEQAAKEVEKVWQSQQKK